MALPNPSMASARRLMFGASALLLLALPPASAVDRKKFKTCDQAAFCKRNRFLKDGSLGPGYAIVEGSLRVVESEKKLLAKLKNTKYPLQDPLPLTLSLLNNNTFRVQITEENPLHKRWEAATPSADVLVPSTIQPMQEVALDIQDDQAVVSFGDTQIFVAYDPFTIEARMGGKPVLSVNDLGLMNFEAYRPKESIADENCESVTFEGPHKNKYTSDCPDDGCQTFASLVEGLEACEKLADCGAVVERPENGDLPFELRKERKLQPSPGGETAYTKKCNDECKFTAYSPPAADVTLEGWAEKVCKVIEDGSGSACHPKKYDSVSTAQRACALLDGCAGITDEDGDGKWSLRTSSEPRASSGSTVYRKVCTDAEPNRKVVAVSVGGHAGIHSFRMGKYNVVPGSVTVGSRPLYKHVSEDYFLYHSEPDKAWALGPKPGDSDVWMYTKSEAEEVNSATGSWSYYDGDSETWIEDAEMSVGVAEVELEARGEAIEPAAKKEQKFPPVEEGMWEERFDGHTDSKPRGPAAVALDVTYDGADHVYGLAEHASTVALKDTTGKTAGAYSDPYRLYNLDVFEYELDVPMALYGAIPLVTAHSKQGTVSSFWLNSAETFIDIEKGNRGKVAHWISESGTIDLFLMFGDSPKAIAKEYALLTGFQAMPQEFSLGYHQCRWNYKDEDDVKTVDAGFDEHDIPYDTIWLDIEHTDGKKYFTWDSSLFPTPKAMQDNIKSKGRKMVTIIDPHIKRDNNYHVHKDAEAQGLYVKQPGGGGKSYEGWCWPGSVSYLDFFNPNTLEYWSNKFSFDEYEGSTDILYTWNDMNEPSVFNGPEVTMKKDALHWDDVEHRDVHNLYGMQVAKGTWHGQAKRLGKRPFVLTRSFFAGSQRFGAMWTGDNEAKWDHLEASVPMLLSMGLSGFPFVGADVGGFFGDPDEELLLRWYQVGAFYPFFRGHGHIDTKRREPWLFGEPWTTRIRDAIRTRYRLLPYVYTLFSEAATEGLPVMRPLFMEFPSDESTFEMEDQFMLGDTILVKPVTKKGATTASVYFPAGVWYGWDTYVSFKGPRSATVKAPIDKIPIFLRGGFILTAKERARRNSLVMKKDPYTLYVPLDAGKAARGTIFLDDGESMESPSLLVGFSFAPKETGSGFVLRSEIVSDNGYQAANIVERVVVLGLSTAAVKSVEVVGEGGNKVLEFMQTDKHFTVRKPGVGIAATWEIHIDY